MPNGSGSTGSNSWNNWVVFGIAIIIGFLIGWCLNDLLDVRVVSNGTISTYHQDSGKVTLVVNQGQTGVVTSSVFGPHRKSVQIVSAGGTVFPISSCFPDPQLIPPYNGAQTSATAKAAVFWNLPPGSYEIRVGYDAGSPGDGEITNLHYPDFPTVIAANSSIRSTTTPTVFRLCPTDMYYFHASNGDETKITIVMQSGM